MAEDHGGRIYGSTCGMAPIKSLERQGLGSCRYQESGVREIIAVNVQGLTEFAGEAGITRSATGTYMEYFEDILDRLLVPTNLELFQQKGGVMFKGAMRPCSFCYIPMVYIVLERTFGDANSYGFQTSAFDKTEKSVQVFKEMTQQLKVVAGSEDVLFKFWELVCQAL